MNTPAFEQALSHLLPQGYAWPRDAQSVWMRLLAGVAASLAEHHAWVQQAAREWLPHATHTRLEEWEAATGLPDPCFGVLDYETRRTVLLARLRGYVGAYEDSSPASLGGIQTFCDALGVSVTLYYHTPLRVGRDRCGRRLGANDGRLYVLYDDSGAEPLRVGVGRVGQRLILRAPQVLGLVCALEAIVPARFEIVMTPA